MDSLFDKMTSADFQKAGLSKPASRVAEFNLFWSGLYQAKHKTIYLSSPARDNAIIARLVRRLDAQGDGLVLLKHAAERFLNGHIKWFKGRETIGAFSSHINHLITDENSTHGGVSITTEEERRLRDISRSGD